MNTCDVEELTTTFLWVVFLISILPISSQLSGVNQSITQSPSVMDRKSIWRVMGGYLIQKKKIKKQDLIKLTRFSFKEITFY